MIEAGTSKPAPFDIVVVHSFSRFFRDHFELEKLDNLVAEHLADRLLQPERLEEILASVLDRRQERAERRREHIAELNKRAAEMTYGSSGSTTPSRLALPISMIRR